MGIHAGGGTENKTDGCKAFPNNCTFAVVEMKAFVVLVVGLALANGLPMAKEESAVDKFMTNLRDCVEGDTLLCLKVCEVL